MSHGIHSLGKDGSFSLTPEMAYDSLVHHVRGSSVRYREWQRSRAPDYILRYELGYWGGLYAAARLLGAVVGAHPRALDLLEPPTTID